MATVFSSQLVPTSSHKELNLSQSQYILCAWTAPSVASCLVSWLIVAMCGHVWPRNPSMSLPSKRVEGDEDITSLGTFASKHASFCRLWNPIHSQCDVESNYKNLSFPVKKNLPILRALSPEFSAHLYHVAATTHIYVLRLHIQIFQQAVGTVLVVLVQRTWMKRTHGCTHLTTSQSYDTHMTYMTYSLHTHTYIYIYIHIYI